MKRRSFLKGLFAVVAAPLVVTQKIFAGEAVPRSVKSLKTFSGVLGRKYRMPIYDDELIGSGRSNTIAFYARSLKTEKVAPQSPYDPSDKEER